MIKPFTEAVIAGWSSQVARRAHNPKVARFESRPRNHSFRGLSTTIYPHQIRGRYHRSPVETKRYKQDKENEIFEGAYRDVCD